MPADSINDGGGGDIPRGPDDGILEYTQGGQAEFGRRHAKNRARPAGVAVG